MIFRAHPELRSAETRTYCIGGPAWSRHVVAQVRLARDERFVCEVDLGGVLFHSWTAVAILRAVSS